jgi:hypothetical protein
MLILVGRRDCYILGSVEAVFDGVSFFKARQVTLHHISDKLSHRASRANGFLHGVCKATLTGAQLAS